MLEDIIEGGKATGCAVLVSIVFLPLAISSLAAGSIYIAGIAAVSWGAMFSFCTWWLYGITAGYPESKHSKYRAVIKCRNCLKVDIIDIDSGIKIKETPCPFCACMALGGYERE